MKGRPKEQDAGLTDESLDGLRILQPRRGYRYSVDALLLADFARPGPRAKVLELGAGCGVISMLMARAFPGIEVKALEVQEALVRVARMNVSRNQLEERIEVVHGDLNHIEDYVDPGTFDYTVCNPPYRPLESGRLCKDAQEALARHEILATLEGILRAARYALRPGGRLAVVYPADRSARLLVEMSRARIEPKRMAFVHPAGDREARMVLVEGCKDARPEVRVMPPVLLDR